MTNEIQTDATKVLGDVKAEIGKLETAEHSASGWVKTHLVICYVLASFLFGCVVGHYVHL